LRSSVQGNFQTRGRYSAATVRGTQWQMADRCDGTFTHVTRGTVVVTDLRRHKQNIVVSAGQSYLARAVGKVRSAVAR
jgi:ferric-dicitrate binding protein FerR (iron transport regulator)